jgi:hypothetical protein
MNSTHLLEKILDKISETSNHINDVLSKNSMHQLDIDLIKQQLLGMYENALKLTSETTEIKEEVIEENTKILEIEETEPTKVELISKKIKEENAAELNAKTKTESVKGKGMQEAIEKKTAEASLNDQLSRQFAQSDLSSKLQTKPISNIQKAIGLNDRFQFINELFDGNQETYHSAIEVLNEKNNFNDAFDYIRSNFDWDMDSELVQRLLTIIRRKLIKSSNE